jgi:hypothetical protein
LGLDRCGASPAVQQKIVYAGAQATSFVQAKRDLEQLADLQVGAKQVERVTERIGHERLAQRDAAVEDFRRRPLVEREAVADPQRVVPQVVMVSVDGGRLQIRERDEVPGTVDSHWRESKVAVLETLASAVQATDPDPDLPRCFLDAARTLKMAREIGHVASGTEVVLPEVATEAQPTAGPAEPTADPREYPPRPSRPGRPVRLVRSVVATRAVAAVFGWLVHAAAWSRNFFGAARRAFLADGQEANWVLWRHHFPTFEPILDFIHALTYVFAAATAGRSAEAGWEEFQRWIQRVWAGRVREILPELERRCAELGQPPSDAPETDPRRVVADALRYLTNNAPRMQYEKYRRLGLPITTSAVESTIKLINRRVKGSEKFWSNAGAEAMLQLRADYLSETLPMDRFWAERRDQASGQRAYRKAG